MNMIHLMKKYWTLLKNMNQIYLLALKYFLGELCLWKKLWKKKSKKADTFMEAYNDVFEH